MGENEDMAPLRRLAAEIITQASKDIDDLAAAFEAAERCKYRKIVVACASMSISTLESAVEEVRALGRWATSQRDGLAHWLSILELDDPEASHRGIAAIARELGVELVAVGTDLYGVPPIDLEAAIELVNDLSEGDLVLAKGSRVAGLERLVDAVEAT